MKRSERFPNDHTCPRSDEVPATFRTQPTFWHEGEVCSFCGSMHPDVLMEHIEAGTATIDPTDKNYKIYVHTANPRVGKRRIVSFANHKPDGDGWFQLTEELLAQYRAEGACHPSSGMVGDYVQFSNEPATTQSKFYFQHLSSDQQKRFVELLNEKKIKLNTPGFFYRLPFFIQKI